MSDSIVQVAPDSTGKKIDTSELTVGSNTVERQRTVIADDATAAALAKVQNAAPGSTDYGLTVRQAGDGLIAENAALITSAATIFTQDTAGYAWFQLQLSGTFSFTLIVEQSDDNSNWIQSYIYQNQTNNLPATPATSMTSAGQWYAPVRARYVRVRCSSFSSNSSSALTAVFRSTPMPVEYVNVNVVATGSTSLSIAPSLSAPQGTVGVTSFVKSANTTNATNVRSFATNVIGLLLANNSATDAFFKLYNKASSPTVGTDTPVAVLCVPAKGSLSFVPQWGFPKFSTGVSYAITAVATDSDTTAVGANDVSGWILCA